VVALAVPPVSVTIEAGFAPTAVGWVLGELSRCPLIRQALQLDAFAPVW